MQMFVFFSQVAMCYVMAQLVKYQTYYFGLSGHGFEPWMRQIFFLFFSFFLLFLTFFIKFCQEITLSNIIGNKIIYGRFSAIPDTVRLSVDMQISSEKKVIITYYPCFFQKNNFFFQKRTWAISSEVTQCQEQQKIVHKLYY